MKCLQNEKESVRSLNVHLYTQGTYGIEIVSDSAHIGSIFLFFLTLYMYIFGNIFSYALFLFSFIFFFGGLLLLHVCICDTQWERKKGSFNSSLYDDKKFHIRPALLWFIEYLLHVAILCEKVFTWIKVEIFFFKFYQLL